MASTEVFMSGKRYTDEFKIEAVRQVNERGHRVADPAVRSGRRTGAPCRGERQGTLDTYGTTLAQMYPPSKPSGKMSSLAVAVDW